MSDWHTKRIEQRGWICMQQYRWDDQPSFTFIPSNYKPSADYTEYRTFAPVMEHTLVFDMPADFDPRPEQIAALEEQKREITAKFQAAVTEINARISKLHAIEYAA